MNHLRTVTIGLAIVTVLTAVAAFGTDDATMPQPTIGLASLPPLPTPLPPLRLPQRTVFAADDGGGPGGQGATLAGSKDVSVSYGVIGVALDGENSVASILGPSGIIRVGLLPPNNVYLGRRVVGISMMGVRLDNGTIIHRGIGANNGQPLTVPAITSTDAPLPARPTASESMVMGQPGSGPTRTRPTAPLFENPFNAAPVASPLPPLQQLTPAPEQP